MYLKFTYKQTPSRYGIWKVNGDYTQICCVYYGTAGKPKHLNWMRIENFLDNYLHACDVLTDDEAFLELI